MKDIRPLTYNVLLLLFLGLLFSGLIRAPRWEWYHFVVCIVAAGFVALLGNMDRLESFKAGAGGIEAKTREVVAKAEVAISEIQLLAEAVVKILLQVIEGSGRWGGMGPAERDAQKAELLAVLARLGVPPDQRDAIATTDRPYVIVDYAAGVTEGLPRDARQNQEWNTAWSPWRDKIDRPAPEQLREIMRAFGPHERWREALLDDYEHYWRHSQHRRPEVWAQRERWRQWTASDGWPEG
jgi:hypothetical protein